MNCWVIVAKSYVKQFLQPTCIVNIKSKIGRINIGSTRVVNTLSVFFCGVGLVMIWIICFVREFTSHRVT